MKHAKDEMDISMNGNLIKTRDIAPYDHERGKVGWAHWRTRKKQATAQHRRRNFDKKIIAEELEEME